MRAEHSRRVAVVFHEPVVGGAAIAVLGALPQLESRGWEFTFWVPPGALQDHLRQTGHRVAGEPRLLRYSWPALRTSPGPMRRLATVPGYLRHFRQWLRLEAPGLLHANTLITIPEAFVAQRTGLPVLTYVHEILPAGPRGRAAALALRRLSHVAACSEAARSALSAHGVHASVAQVGVAAPVGSAVESHRSDDQIVIGTVGTISQRKGSDIFVAAARDAMARDPRLEFRMAGALASGPEEAWARALVAEAEAAGIRYLGHVDVAREMSGWDLFVLASRRDPFPLAVLEAMAAELPIVGARVDGLADQVTDECGLLVPPENGSALTEAIVELAAMPDPVRAAMGRAGRLRVVERFGIERTAEGLHEAYLAALAASEKRSP